MRSVDLFFCLRIRLKFLSYQRERRKMNFLQVLPRNSMEIYLSEEYCDQDWRLGLKNLNKSSFYSLVGKGVINDFRKERSIKFILFFSW